MSLKIGTFVESHWSMICPQTTHLATFAVAVRKSRIRHSIKGSAMGGKRSSADIRRMMLQPPPPHVINILVAAQSKPKVGKAFANGFDDPRTYFPWLVDPAEAEKFIQAA